jgi:YD repeat-containing protein
MRRLQRRSRTLLVLLVSVAVAVFGLATRPARPAAAAERVPISYAYDDAGQLVGVTDPAGDTAAYHYDEVGNLTGITRQASSALSVLSVTPSHGAAGAQVTVAGTGFAAEAGDNEVRFGSAAAVVTSANANRSTS